METQTDPNQHQQTQQPATQTNGNEPGSWRTTLPEDLRGNASIAKYNDVPSLAKAHVELTQKLGEPKLPVPQANWTEKEYGELYSKLGRPDKPEGYQFGELKDLPQGLTYSPDMDKWFAEKAFKLGLSSAQGKALRDDFVGWQVERAKGMTEEITKQKSNQSAELEKIKSEYGTRWEPSVDAAKKIVSEFGGPEVKQFLETSGLGDDPRMVRMMLKIGQAMMDHSVITGSPRISGAFTGGPAAAQAELDKMNADPEVRKALTKANHPQHDAMVKKKSELMRALNPVET